MEAMILSRCETDLSQLSASKSLGVKTIHHCLDFLNPGRAFVNRFFMSLFLVIHFSGPSVFHRNPNFPSEIEGDKFYGTMLFPRSPQFLGKMDCCSLYPSGLNGS